MYTTASLFRVTRTSSRIECGGKRFWGGQGERSRWAVAGRGDYRVRLRLDLTLTQLNAVPPPRQQAITQLNSNSMMLNAFEDMIIQRSTWHEVNSNHVALSHGIQMCCTRFSAIEGCVAGGNRHRSRGIFSPLNSSHVPRLRVMPIDLYAWADANGNWDTRLVADRDTGLRR